MDMVKTNFDQNTTISLKMNVLQLSVFSNKEALLHLCKQTFDNLEIEVNHLVLDLHAVINPYAEIDADTISRGQVILQSIKECTSQMREFVSLIHILEELLENEKKPVNSGFSFKRNAPKLKKYPFITSFVNSFKKCTLRKAG